MWVGIERDLEWEIEREWKVGDVSGEGSVRRVQGKDVSVCE